MAEKKPIQRELFRQRPGRIGLTSKLTPAIHEQVVALLTKRTPIRTVLRTVGISWKAWYNWMRKGNAGLAPMYVRFYEAVEAIYDGTGKRSWAMQRYPLDENHFARIDTPNKAWALGFIATDGNVRCYKGNNILKIKLGITDRVVLEWFKAELKSGAPIKDLPASTCRRRIKGGGSQVVRSGPASVIHFSNEKLVAGLRKHGIEPRKTFTVKPWQGPPNLQAAYWRGCVDGDGWISPLKERVCGERRWQLGYSGNLEMVSGFADFVASVTGERPTVHPDDTIFAVNIGALPVVQAVLRVLYQEGQFALPRKASLAREALAAKLLRHRRTETRDEFLAAYTETGSWRKAAKKLGIPLGSIDSTRRRLGLLGS